MTPGDPGQHGTAAIPSECWLHPAVDVGDSAIDGLGLFARDAIAEGAPVSRLGGVVVTTAGLEARIAARQTDPALPFVDAITIGRQLHLVLPPGTPNHHGNHSCDPNLWWTNALTLAARRDIEPGEELTNDYATSTAVPGFRMECRCGSSLCRGVVTGDDWRRPDLQQRYGDHWSFRASVQNLHGLC